MDRERPTFDELPLSGVELHVVLDDRHARGVEEAEELVLLNRVQRG